MARQDKIKTRLLREDDIRVLAIRLADRVTPRPGGVDHNTQRTIEESFRKVLRDELELWIGET